MIRKGHDGPARRGFLHFAEERLETPALLGPASSAYSKIQYCTVSALNESTSGFYMCSTGSLFQEGAISYDIKRANMIYLLPSMTGLSAMPSEIGINYVRAQLPAIPGDQSDRSCFAIRIPSNISDSDMHALVELIKASEITVVAFTFNGENGPPDLRNLTLRSMLPRNVLCIALGRIPPSMLPLLYYVGFDVIDFGYAFEAASRNLRLWGLDEEPVGFGSERRYCSCVYCMGTEKESTDPRTLLEKHNASIYAQVLSSAIHFAANGNLRWFVESKTHASPEAASFLRRIDSSLYSFLEEFTPNHVGTKIPFIGTESYYSPTVIRFREFVARRYKPSDDKKLVVLFPCSARKPYSDSKSHRRFSAVLDRILGNKRDAVAETIITSPLGLVPRELERIYPAGYYDIPVTGQWDAEETTIAAEALVTHLSKFDESVVVIAHVSGGYLDVVRQAEVQIRQSIIYTAHEASPTSNTALAALKDTISDLLDIITLLPKRSTLLDTIRATADFMFGEGAGDCLAPSDASVRGKVYGSIICRVSNAQTCLYSGINGRLSLTLEGGKRLASLGRYWVRFDAPQIEGSSIFAVGVSSADTAIRPGDEVIVVDSNDRVLGVGRSEMSGQEMCDFTNGIAVRIRHKEK